MIRALATFAVLAASTVAFAEPTVPVAEGVVLDHQSGQPVKNATVIAQHAGITYTDDTGHFALALAPRGRDPVDQILTIVASGYVPFSIPITGQELHIELEPSAPVEDSPDIAIDAIYDKLAADTKAAETKAADPKPVDAVAKSDEPPPGEVILVTGKAPEQTKPVSYQLTTTETRQLPGAGNDLLRAAQALPGVARIPYAFGALVLRGTSPRDSAVFVDGIEVPLAFHFGGLTSFYPSSLLEDVAITPGGFDVSYGRAQGGIVTLTTREPRTEHWRAGGAIGLIDSGVMAEGPVASGGIAIGIRHAYLDTIAQSYVADDIPLPSSWDAQVRLSFGDPRKAGRIAPILFLSMDNVANRANGLAGGKAKLSLSSTFARFAVPYSRMWGPFSLHVVPWLGINQLEFLSVNGGQIETFTRPQYPAGLRVDLTRDYAWGHLRGGLDNSNGYLSQTQIGFTGSGTGPVLTSGMTTVTWSDIALWGEARVQVDGERFAVRPGLRVEQYGLNGEGVVDPRINIHQKLSSSVTLRQSLGRFHQPPTPADVDPKDGNPFLRSSYVDQASLGVDLDLGDYTSSVTGFYDSGSDLGIREPTFRPGDNFTPDVGGLGPTMELVLEKQLGFALYRKNLGRARSYGLEVLVKHSIGSWFGLISYTLSVAERTEDPKIYVGWRPFELDQTHNLNAAISTMAAGWRVGARVHAVSGNPYSPTMSTTFGPVQQPWAATLPTFFQLDVRADRRWKGDYGDVNFYIDIQNIENRRNIEGRTYNQSLGRDEEVPSLPIMPFIGLEFIPK